MKAAIDIAKMSPEEYRNYRRRERRRALGRKNQERYRNRKRQEEQMTQFRIVELRNRVTQLTWYNTLLTRGEYLNPARTYELRGMIANLYPDYFEYGVQPNKPAMFMKQQTFLECHFRDDLVYQSSRFPKGFPTLLKQWELLTILHEGLRMRNCTFEPAAPNGEIFKIRSTITMKITHRTITTLYPHMLQDYAFFQAVIEKDINIPAVTTLQFGDDNKVQMVKCELDLAKGWCSLVNDVAMTARVLKEMLIEDNYILLDPEQMFKSNMSPEAKAG